MSNSKRKNPQLGSLRLNCLVMIVRLDPDPTDLLHLPLYLPTRHVIVADVGNHVTLNHRVVFEVVLHKLIHEPMELEGCVEIEACTLGG